MKLLVNVFLISYLFAAEPVFCQKDHVFKSIDEAQSVAADSVYRLDLSRKRLKEIPKAIYQFKNLRELNLSKNKLRDIPEKFVFRDLRILDLSKNKFKTFPTVICKNTANQLIQGH